MLFVYSQLTNDSLLLAAIEALNLLPAIFFVHAPPSRMFPTGGGCLPLEKWLWLFWTHLEDGKVGVAVGDTIVYVSDQKKKTRTQRKFTVYLAL